MGKPSESYSAPPVDEGNVAETQRASAAAKSAWRVAGAVARTRRAHRKRVYVTRHEKKRQHPISALTFAAIRAVMPEPGGRGWRLRGHGGQHHVLVRGRRAALGGVRPDARAVRVHRVHRLVVVASNISVRRPRRVLGRRLVLQRGQHPDLPRGGGRVGAPRMHLRGAPATRFGRCRHRHWLPSRTRPPQTRVKTTGGKSRFCLVFVFSRETKPVSVDGSRPFDQAMHCIASSA